jgi:hypothetical protein
MTADDTLWDLEERFWTQGADSARHATAKGASSSCPILQVFFRATRSGEKRTSPSGGVRSR